MTDERADLIVLDYPAGHRRLFSWCLSGDVDCIDEIATARVPDLLQDRLAKLAQHAAHADMVVGAVAQHGLRVTPVTQRLQGQSVRVLEPVVRSVDASQQRRLVRDCPCLRASSLLAHRATLRHLGCGHPLDISYSSGHSTTLYESALARIRFSGVFRGERVCLHAFLRGRTNPIWWTLSRAPAWASSEVASLRPRGTRAAGPWGRPWPPPECTPRGHSGAPPGPCRPAPAPRGLPGFRVSSSPGSPPPAPGPPAEVAAGARN